MPKLPPVYAFSEKSAGRSNRLPVSSTPWSRETFSLAHLAVLHVMADHVEVRAEED